MNVFHLVAECQLAVPGSVYEWWTSQSTQIMHVQVPLDKQACSGCTVDFPGPLDVSLIGATISIVYLSDDMLHTRYKADGVIEGCSMRKKRKVAVDG